LLPGRAPGAQRTPDVSSAAVEPAEPRSQRRAVVSAITERAKKLLDSRWVFALLALCFITSLHPSEQPRNAFWTPLAEDSVNQLIAFLLDHAMLDFSGDLSIDMVKEFLRGDDSPESRALLAKLVQERSVDSMFLTLADCLQEHLRTGLTDDVMREQLRLYSES
jgi:hypothetical protein